MNEKNIDLPQLIAGCKQGDVDSYNELVDLYAKKLYGFFYRLSGNRAVSNDLLSELFVKLVERIDKFRGGNFNGWIFRVASNLWHDWLRAKQRDVKAMDARAEQLREKQQLDEQKDSDDEASELLDKQLKRLDDDTRELIMMRYYSDMSFKEIAEVRGEPLGTVLSKVHRGMKKLREMMEQYDHG